MFCLKITILNSVELQVCDSQKEARTSWKHLRVELYPFKPILI